MKTIVTVLLLSFLGLSAIQWAVKVKNEEHKKFCNKQISTINEVAEWRWKQCQLFGYPSACIEAANIAFMKDVGELHGMGCNDQH